MRWDIFCKVIDNFGDIGVCWRLARQIANSGQRARLWVDDDSALTWMAPGGTDGVEVRPWHGLAPEGIPPGDVLVEAFGCDITPDWVQAVATPDTAWINLEYLSAEPYVERMHGLPSPVLSGPLAGWHKRFFYPGFTPGTGGLLREPDLQERQRRFDRASWVAAQGIQPEPGAKLISLFCYEPAALSALLEQLARPQELPQIGGSSTPSVTHLLVTAGRATGAVQNLLQTHERHRPGASLLQVHYLPRLSQDDYDHLLWACDLNFVRGEDSLVRALWAARPSPDMTLQAIPFVWQLYPQHDDAHHDKLRAFLNWVQASPSSRAFHEIWNGLSGSPLPGLDIPNWGVQAQRAQSRARDQADLLTQLSAMAVSMASLAHRS
ncbi:elongation factor P maturation arginine rhamnosyltransferase EarP [Hylemonella sp. W303a]|uniref:elongation factor P maturation arginine rhamnosyltransferase EarP n=1 Tax=Hylemonella sp. W303a TaxID=3389873 RepID=UPI00396B41F3